jgi:hypothetical protein
MTQRPWLTTAVAAGLNLVGMTLDLRIGRTVPGMPWWPNAISMTISAVLLALMLSGRRGPRVTSVGFVLNNLGIVAALWVTNAMYATTIPGWVPFRPHHLGLVAVAVLAPPAMWAGLTSVALFVGTALVQLYTFPPALREQQTGEPWIILVYGIFATVLLLYRAQRMAADQARIRAESDARAMQRLARSFLALRDLTNTPLQTLVLSAAQLRERNPGLEELAGRIDRAVERLQEATRIAHDYEQHLRWEPGDTSFDAEEILRGPKG